MKPHKALNEKEKVFDLQLTEEYCNRKIKLENVPRKQFFWYPKIENHENPTAAPKAPGGKKQSFDTQKLKSSLKT